MDGLPWFVMALTGAAAVSTIVFLGELLRSLPTDPAVRTERLPIVWRLAWPLLIAGGCLVRPIISARWRFNLNKKLSGAGFERTMAPQHIVAAQALSLVSFGRCLFGTPAGRPRLSYLDFLCRGLGGHDVANDLAAQCGQSSPRKSFAFAPLSYRLVGDGGGIRVATDGGLAPGG